jgi:hypothetical protein
MRNFDESGRIRNIPSARSASPAEGLAEVEIFATLQVPGRWIRTPTISALGQEPPLRRKPK